MHISKLAVVLTAMLPAAAGAQTQPAAAATEIVEPTCSDLMVAIRVADAGERPSSKRKAQAREAQDDIATALFWLHGWHTAKGKAALPVRRDWLVAELNRVVEACRAQSPDGAALVSQVATQ